MAVTLHYFGMSQPSRSVQLLLEAEKIPYTLHIVNIFKGEHKTEEYVKICPNQSIPAIEDGPVCLFESAAILRYLTAKYKTPDHWYPQDLQKRAKIDQYLDWHHSNTRRGCFETMYYKHILPAVTDKEPNMAKVQESEVILEKTLRLLEDYYLKDTKFINSSEISIADLMAVCEMTEFWLVGEDAIKDRPRLQKWLDDCKEALSPHFDKAHKEMYRIRDEGFKNLTK